MDLRCFVKVLPGAAGEWAGGTGYLISRELVLTAAHLVRDAEQGKIAYDETEGRGSVARAGRVEWRGEGECDIALLRLIEPVDLEVPLAALADSALDSGTRWESRGWALASTDDELVCDSTVDLLGTAASFLPHQKRFQLTLDALAKKLTWWKGVSGAPVFHQGARRILGVVAEAPRQFLNTLKATPLTVAFRDPEFAKALGPPIVFKRRDDLSARVAAILAASPEAAAAVAQRRDAWRKAYESGQPERLTEVLLAEADVAEALSELLKAYAGLPGGQGGVGRRAAEAIEQILFAVAPLLVLRGVLHGLPNEEGAVYLSLPLTTRSIAELAVAGYEGRPARWKAGPAEEPDGLGRLPLPGESGFDPQGEVAIEDYAQYLRDHVLTPRDREHLKRLRASYPDDPARELKETFALAGEEFEFRATSALTPLRSYLLFDRAWANKNAVLIGQLRENLGTIHYVELSGEDYRAERRISRILSELLDKKDRPHQGEEN